MPSRRSRRTSPRLRVLVTGCSSGIGRATAERFLAHGHTVVATARNRDTLDELARAGCTVLALDVTEEDSMVAAIGAAVADLGGIDVLVNNAGFGLYGAVEERDLADARGQFSTNLFGPLRLIQLLLPGMRSRGYGRIVNVSSMGGRTTLPGGGYYHASKHALEAISDALRLEVAPFGVDVVLIEPGPVHTPWASGAVATMLQPTAPAEGSPYESFTTAVATMLTSVNSGPLPWYASSADDVARVIVRAAEARRPRARYLVGAAAHLLVGTRRLLPDRVHDRLLRLQFGLEGRRRPAYPGTSGPTR